ncbi:hypothetical protein DJ568_15505 [Mucilaginibacter hurinus]|uniref:ATP-dependent Clp protease proteolytic subunit n=1 Tax=Mucilaginibacter hurinus TaxID=2201324 RepID=A0A367GKD6_9SPHI|nr:Clp protease ClpP [Mucilaginibacter hurinus]RCH53944.1 hypothetical protein DJ568_15505 [Mucilaginibacter hurinus]
MSKQAHIFIYGDIFNYPASACTDNGIVCLKNVIDVINANPGADEFIVHIHSRGGDVNEGFAIYDALINSGKKITTVIEGLCGSIATVVALAGTTRRMNENAEFMIHNAWYDPSAMKEYTADAYAGIADFIREADDKLLALYIKATGAPVNDIRAKMDRETFLSSDEALALGFITEIVQPGKAVAYIYKPQQSTKPKLTNMSKVKTLVAKATKALMALAGAQAAEATLEDGTKIYYDGDLAVGTAVFTDEELTTPAADGDLVLEDGTVLTIAAGAITEVKDEEKSDDKADVAALKARVKALEAKNAALKNENTEAVNALAKFSTRLAAMKGNYIPQNGGNNPGKFRSAQQSGNSRFVRPEKKAKGETK